MGGPGPHDVYVDSDGCPLTPKAIALLLHESPVAVRLRGHGADLDTAAAIAGTIGNDDAAMLLASLDKKRRDGQKGWVSSTTLARILSHYPASARAKPGSKSGKSVVHATYKGVRYWNRKLVASLQCRMDDVDAMPLDDDDVVDPDDPVLHTLPPRRGHLPLGLVEWMTAQELAHVVAVHPVFGSV